MVHSPSASGSRVGLNPQAVVHRASEPLLAPEVALRRLNGDVTQEELDLIPLATGHVAQARARAPKIMRRLFLNAGPERGLVAGLARRRRRIVGEEAPPLRGREPIPEANAKAPPPFTRRIPAADSGLSKPASAAS